MLLYYSFIQKTRNRMYYKVLSIIFAIVMIGCISCKKKYEIIPLDYIAEGSWKIVKLDVKVGNNGVWTDGFAGMPACRKDDEWIFFRTGNYQVSEGATKCNAADPQIYIDDTWRFSSDGKKVIFSAVMNLEWAIEKLDAAQFISTSSQDIGPNTYYYRRTMQHQ